MIGAEAPGTGPAQAGAGQDEVAGPDAASPMGPEQTPPEGLEPGGLVLVILADSDARVDLSAPMLGSSLSERLAANARRAGFARVVGGPGLRVRPDSSSEHAIGEHIDAPGLIVWESTYIDPELLRLMIEHPLDADERFALYDAVGRPAACFAGHIGPVPPMVPVAESLDLPERFGPHSLARIVDDEDRVRAERLVAACESELDLEGSSYNRWLGLWSLRWLTRTRASVAQLELLALLTAVASGISVLSLEYWGLVLGALFLFATVHLARMLRPLRALGTAAYSAGTSDDDGYEPGETLAELVRPLGHAVFIGTCTYRLVAEADRSQVAALVLLAAGGLAVLMDLARVRHLLRRGPPERLALPRAEAWVRRLGVRMPSPLVQAPLLELGMFLGALTGQAGVPWTLAVAAAISRLWPWFVSPADQQTGSIRRVLG